MHLSTMLRLARASTRSKLVSRSSSSSSCPSTTPAEVYQSRIESGELTRDEHQAAVVERLQSLHSRVRPFRPPPPGQRRSWAFALRNAVFGAEHTSSRAPRGVYIWGTVGGGKTMLMDMFFDVAEVEEAMKARVHYHDFMQVVHNLMHEAKKSAPPRDANR